MGALKMTLIAGYFEAGVPILIGDFLITGEQYNKFHKKAHKISDNFVAAWTGHAYAAQAVLKDLHKAFGEHRVTVEQIEAFLMEYPVTDLGSLSVHLIAWIVESEPKCFLWNSQHPQQLFFDSIHYDGSGGDLMPQLVGEGSMQGTVGSDEPVKDQAIRRSLDNCLRLIAEEVYGNDFKEFGFGHAYEVLYFDADENRFQYIDNVLFGCLAVFFDKRNRFKMGKAQFPVYRYINLAENSAVVRTDERIDTTAVEVITGLWSDKPEEHEMVKKFVGNLLHHRHLKKADYYSLSIKFHSPNTNFAPRVTASFKSGAAAGYLDINEDGEYLSFSFNKRTFEELYSTVLNDLLNHRGNR